MTDVVSEPKAAPVRQKRRIRRAWLYAIAFGVVWKVLVFTMGAALPRWLIDDGVTHLPVSMQAYAVDARQTALSLWAHPIERRGIIRTVRVVSVDSTQIAIAPECGGLSARIRAYTYFAIPYSEVRTMCHRGVVEYRVFRRHR